MGKVRAHQIQIGSRAVAVSPQYVYSLPPGLPDGAEVQIISIQPEFIGVEFQGQKFEVHRHCLMVGFDFWIDGQWVDETDPRVPPPEKRGNS